MKTINFQHLFLLVTFFALAACQPKAEAPDAAATETSSPSAPKATIHEAAFMGNAKAMRQHIAAGSDLNEKDAYGSTPLNIAITFNRTDIAQLLIEAEADLSVRSADGSTVLHTAALFGRKKIVESLLAAGVDIDARNDYGSTALEVTELPFAQMKPIYDQLSKDLGPLGLKLDYQQLEAVRPEIAELIKKEQ